MPHHPPSISKARPDYTLRHRPSWRTAETRLPQQPQSSRPFQPRDDVLQEYPTLTRTLRFLIERRRESRPSSTPFTESINSNQLTPQHATRISSKGPSGTARSVRRQTSGDPAIPTTPTNVVSAAIPRRCESKTAFARNPFASTRQRRPTRILNPDRDTNRVVSLPSNVAGKRGSQVNQLEPNRIEQVRPTTCNGTLQAPIRTASSAIERRAR